MKERLIHAFDRARVIKERASIFACARIPGGCTAINHRELFRMLCMQMNLRAPPWEVFLIAVKQFRGKPPDDARTCCEGVAVRL